MNQFNVNPGNVKWVVAKVSNALQQGEQFTFGEVLLGLTEVLGRMIVEVAETPVAGLQSVEVMNNHLKNTIGAGFTAKGYNMTGN